MKRLLPFGLFLTVICAADAAPVSKCYFPPPENQGGWRTLVSVNTAASPEQKTAVRERTGFDWDKLLGAWTYCTNYDGPNSLLVIRHGWIAGEWHNFTQPRGIASCTKSITGLSMAKVFDMSDRGLLKKKVGPDDFAYPYLPVSWGQSEPARQNIRIRHMLTMTPGLTPYDGPYKDDYETQVFAQSVEAPPGTVWAYASAPVDLLSYVIEDVTGRTMGDFFNDEIGSAIGTARIIFPAFSGHSGGSGGPGGGARFTPRDLARVGYLLLHRGAWERNGSVQQVISAERVEQFTQWVWRLTNTKWRQPNFAFEPNANEYYGQLFWTNRTQQGLGDAVPRDAFYMSGWGKQICAVIPSLDMIVVRLGPNRTLNEHPEFYLQLFSRIMAAVTDRHPATSVHSDSGAPKNEAEPIRLHPDNPHYFLFRDRPAVLITAGEHYGAVMNLDFDYLRYLDELKKRQFNLTRVFSGTYREVAGSFNITANPLAPAAGRFVCPWARSQTPGASDGDNKFDLAQWDEAYLDRLKDFIIQAGRRGIVVELVLFCTMYDDTLWNASPMNAKNNINHIGNLTRNEVYSGKDKDLLAVQQAVVRKLVAELNEFDNLYYEVCNEPYERGGLTKQWNDRIIEAIVQTEVSLPRKHLIAQGFPPSSRQIEDLNLHVCVLNFHAAKPVAVRLNYPLNRVVAFDETGGADRSDRKYRTEGWQFILAGGVYDHLDFSFTPQHEDGTAIPLPPGTPGGGGPEIRKQLALLKRFIESFDFVRMKPDLSIVRGPLPNDVSIQVLAEPGRAWAVYLKGGTQADLVFDLPGGSYDIEWIDTKTGGVAKAEHLEHGGGSRTLASPVYSEDIALSVKRRSLKTKRDGDRIVIRSSAPPT